MADRSLLDPPSLAKSAGGASEYEPSSSAAARSSSSSPFTCCSSTLYTIVAAVACALSIGLFVYSLSILKAVPYGGDGCTGDTSCSAGASKCAFLNAWPANVGCGAVCTQASVAAVSPFIFRVPNAGAGSNDQLSCPFPAYNLAWRVPLAFAAAVATALSLRSVDKKWTAPAPNLSLTMVYVVLSCLFLYVLGIDADQVRKGVGACANKFLTFTPIYAGGPYAVQCETPYVFIFVTFGDALVLVGLVVLSVLSWGRYRAGARGG